MSRLRLLPILIASLGATFAAAPAGAQAGSAPADSAKRVAIRRLLAVQRTDSLILAGVEQASAVQAPPSNLPEGFMDAMRLRMHRDIGLFLERLVPIYDSLYSASEIDGLLAFYQTDLGQRLLETQPHLMESMMRLGQQWGMEVAGQVLVDLARQPVRHR